MKYDEVLSSIAWKAKTDNVLLPQKVFVGELGRYLDSGVFKKTNAFLSEVFFADCKEIRELKRIHKWQTSSFNTYVRQAFADKSQTKTARRKSKIEANRKMVLKDLQEL